MNRTSSLNVRILLLIRDPRGFLQSRKHRVWCPGNADCKSEHSYQKFINYLYLSDIQETYVKYISFYMHKYIFIKGRSRNLYITIWLEIRL